MKTISEINRILFFKIIEILLSFFFFCFAFYLYFRIYIVKLSDLNTHSLNYTYLDIQDMFDEEMYPMTDKDALAFLKPCILTVTNYEEYEEDYVLVLKLDKISTIDYHSLHISVNGDVYALEDLDREEEKEYIYFFLDADSLRHESKKIEVQLWLHEKVGNEMQGKEMIVSFALLNTIV